VGPVYDHTIQARPGASLGPVNDDWLSPTANSNTGPVFDHDIEAIIGGIPAHGPVDDSFVFAGISVHGPVFDHIIAAPPPPLEVRDPDAATGPDPIRNQIVPDELEILSPGIYGVAKDDEGAVTGFKF